MKKKLLKIKRRWIFFGKSTLSYNTHRFTTIIAETDGIFGEFLDKIDILNDLDEYKKSKISDCLIVDNFNKDDYIIKQV